MIKRSYLPLKIIIFPKKTDDKSGSGIGIQNLEKRLKLLYPNRYKFNSKVEKDRFLVTLEIETA